MASRQLISLIACWAAVGCGSSGRDLDAVAPPTDATVFDGSWEDVWAYGGFGLYGEPPAGAFIAGVVGKGPPPPAVFELGPCRVLSALVGTGVYDAGDVRFVSSTMDVT